MTGTWATRPMTMAGAAAWLKARGEFPTLDEARAWLRIVRLHGWGDRDTLSADYSRHGRRRRFTFLLDAPPEGQ